MLPWFEESFSKTSILRQFRRRQASHRHLSSTAFKKTASSDDEIHPSGIKLTHAGPGGLGHARKGDFLLRALGRFPGKTDENRCMSLAYGSGVFSQNANAPPSGNMTDFILVVDNPQKWHQQNLELNPSDYSGLMRQLGPKIISDLQTKYGSHMYFNTLVPFENGQIKYGVISRADFISDLLDWDTLYAAGRLQKPVKILENVSKEIDQELHLALRMNLTSALHTALLLLPDRFTEDQLYMTLASMSYMGDFRMTVGEDRNKVSKIVHGSKKHFTDLYGKRIVKMKQFIHKDENSGTFEQDVSPSGRHHHLTMLPKNVQLMLEAIWNSDGRTRDLEDVLRYTTSNFRTYTDFS